MYALVLVCLVGSIVFVQHYPVSTYDRIITREIQEQRTWDPTLLMRFISIFGDAAFAPFPVIIAAVIFYLSYRRREAWFTLAVVIANACNFLVKLLIHRPRPTKEFANIVSQIAEFSFPSGHVVHYVVFFGFLLAVMILDKSIHLSWRIFVGLLSTVLILGVSVSRIYLGAHWATDVIGGYLFGFAYLGILLSYYLKDPKFKLPQSS